MNIKIFCILMLAFSASLQASNLTGDYDSLDRSRVVTRSEAISTGYLYDLSGNRIRKTTKSALTSTSLSFTSGQFLGSIELPSGDAVPSRVLVNVGKNGAFTASLQIGGRKVQWRGTFTMNEGGGGTWAATVNDAVLGPLELRLELPPGRGQMTVTLTHNGQTNTALLAQAGQRGSGEVPSGHYTVLFPANPDFPGAAHPQGDGYALLSVSSQGAAKLTGKLGDGTPFTQGAPLTRDGRFQVFVPLYKGGGVLTGWIDFVPIDEVSDFKGTLQWSKPNLPADALYSAGFDFEIDLLGSKFQRPLTGQRILSLDNAEGNGVLMLGDGNLPETITKSITLDAKNKVRFDSAGSELPIFTIASGTGLFTGSFLHPTLGKRAAFTGVVFQKQRLASGVFLGSSQSGHVTLQAKETSTLLLPAVATSNPSNENTNPPGPQIPTAGLLTHLSFDGGNVSDQSGNNNHGTVSGAVQYLAGRHGLGLKLSGTGGFVDMLPNTFLPTVTASSFVRLDALPANGAYMAVVDAWKDSENYMLGVQRVAGVVTFTAGFHKRATTTSIYPEVHIDSTTQPRIGTIYHVATTFDGQDLKLYVNGQLEATKTVTGSPSTVPTQGNTDVRAGVTRDNSGFLNGLLDEVCLYNRALTPAEIQQLAQ